MSLTAYLFRLTASLNDRKRDEGLTTPEEILRSITSPTAPIRPGRAWTCTVQRPLRADCR